ESKVNFFVPPSNGLNLNSLNQLAKLRVHLLSSGGISCTGLDKYLFLYKKWLVFNRRRALRRALRREPQRLWKYKGILSLGSHTFGMSESATKFLKRVKWSATRTKFLSVATHYMPLVTNEDYRREFHAFLRSAEAELGGVT